MTDEANEVSIPPRRRKAPKEHAPGPRRNGNGAPAQPSLSDVLAAVHGVAGDVANLTRRVEQVEVESGQMRYVEPTVEPKPEIPLSEAMSDFTRGLAERTREVPDHYVGTQEPQYNVPLRTYLKPPPKNRPNAPPEYAELQGDARNVRHYQEKGYYLLTAEEERRYREVERPRLLAEQRTRAALINGLRKLVEREQTLSGYFGDAEWDDSLSNMSIGELEEEWGNLCRQTSNPNRRLPRAERYHVERDAEAERLLRGVDTTPPPSVVEALERQTEQAAQARSRASRTIEVTPHNSNRFR